MLNLLLEELRLVVKNRGIKNDKSMCKNGDKDKMLSIKVYLDNIRLYLRNIINHHKIQGEWEIQLTIALSFISSKDCNEARGLHRNSDNIRNMIGNEPDEIIKELFDSLLQKYEKWLEQSVKGS